MDRRGSNTWLVAVLAVAVGFLAAFLLFRDTGDTSATVGTTDSTTTEAVATTTDTNAATTTTTTTSSPAATPGSPQASPASCVDLWNQANNRGNQTFLVNLMSQQPVRVHVGATTDVPPECLVTVIANDGKAYVFPEGGGNAYPYALAPGATDSSSLPAAQKTSNALEQSDGTLKER
ncbi:MAG TPA: hypothetical protein VE570_05450 [Thermoleophilaceae bacterium]|nr:hypothetical protein [Thermoleophilaceae bacterium]